MSNKIVIGTGQYICSTHPIFRNDGNRFAEVSENRVAFWATEPVLRLDLRIFKNTEEGKELTQMIADDVSDTVVNEWLLLVALKYFSYNDIVTAINALIEREYKRGADDKLKELRTFLGIK